MTSPTPSQIKEIEDIWLKGKDLCTTKLMKLTWQKAQDEKEKEKEEWISDESLAKIREQAQDEKLDEIEQFIVDNHLEFSSSRGYYKFIDKTKELRKRKEVKDE